MGFKDGMRPVLMCAEELLEPLLAVGALPPGERAVFVADKSTLRARIARRGQRAQGGDLEDPALYRDALKTAKGPLIVAASPARFARITAAVHEAAPETPVLVIRDDDRTVPGTTMLPVSAFQEHVVQPALDRAVQRNRVERIRAHFEGAERTLILMQDDPDPDAIASALALKTLLGRSRVSAPICTFGSITRPENVAMCKILDIEVQEISAHALDQFDRVAMVDVQPSFLEERFEE